MSVIHGVMQKISLTKEYPVSLFLDKSSLLTMENLPVSDVDVIEYLTLLQEILDHAVNASDGAPTFYNFDSRESEVIYLWFDFKDSDHWDAVHTSETMSGYLSAKQKVYDGLGWVDHGYKVIEHLSEEILASAYTLVGITEDTGLPEYILDNTRGAEIVWNTVP